MLGTVNGRKNFDKICSVQLSESCDHLICTFPESDISTGALFNISFNFENLETQFMPTEKDKSEKLVDQPLLQKLPVESAERLLAAMLRRENELRLHPRVQAAYALIGEDEAEMSSFTTALQAHVAAEFNVDPVVGIELIRSASTLFPETANLAHYVRYNRCFEGSLSVGDEAPDVNLSTLTGEATTLWTEVNERRHSRLCDADGEKPVVILGASYT
jgi:hypothetical protein